YAESGEGRVGRIRVVGINHGARSVLRRHAGIGDIGQRVSAGCRGKDLSVAQTDNADVVVLTRDSNRAYGLAGLEWRLAHHRHGAAGVDGPVEPVGAEVEVVRRPRTKSHGSVEQYGVAANDSVVVRRALAAQESPAVVVRVGSGNNTSEANQVVRLIEIGVVH